LYDGKIKAVHIDTPDAGGDGLYNYLYKS